MRFKILKQGGYGASGGLSESGGNMSGPLVLAGNPTQPLHASTKGYVDSALGNLNGASLITGLIPVERLPAFTGDLTNVAGSNVFTLSNSGITPSTYPKVTVNAKGRITNGYLLSEADLPGLDWNKITTGKPNTRAGYGITDGIAPSGGTMTGDLVVNNDPTAPLHIATKGYVDAIVAGNAAGSVKTGDMIRKTTATTPSGFLKCNGGDVSKTVYSALYSVIGDTYSAYNTAGSGQPWARQYEHNLSEQSILSWSQSVNVTPSSGGSLYNSQIVVTKNRVYVLGGSNPGGPGSYSSAIFMATIDANGNVNAFTEIGSMPATIGMGQCVITKNTVYIIGGVVSNGESNNIFGATINSDGTLGSFSNLGYLPAHTRCHSVLVIKNKIYVFCGISALGASKNIYRCDINADGTLGTWTTLVDAKPFKGYWQNTAVIKNYVYIFGGYNDVGGMETSIYYAPINTDGTLGTWTLSGVTLPINMTDRSEVFVTKKYLYIVHQTVVAKIVINVDGTLGTASRDTNLTIPSAYGVCGFLTSKYMYMIGSNDSNYMHRTAFNGITNDYSDYYSGTMTTTDPTNFRLPDFSAKEMPGSYTYIKF